MKFLPLPLISILMIGVGGAIVPEWVQSGVSATYKMISGGGDEARGTAVPNSGAEVYVINRIDQVTAR
jgi:hypothetical protein